MSFLCLTITSNTNMTYIIRDLIPSDSFTGNSAPKLLALSSFDPLLAEPTSISTRKSATSASASTTGVAFKNAPVAGAMGALAGLVGAAVF